MNNKGLYESLVLPEPYTILGLTLKPFSFGHFIILKRFNVGFVSDKTEKLTIEDLIFSVFVCSKTFEECEKLLYSGQWTEHIKAWAKFVDEGLSLNWPEKALLFNDYIAAHTRRPDFRPVKQEGDPVESNAEWYEHILKFLHQHYSHSEVMNMCWGKGYYEFLASLEAKGQIVFFGDRQYKVLEAAKRMKVEKEKAKSNG